MKTQNARLPQQKEKRARPPQEKNKRARPPASAAKKKSAPRIGHFHENWAVVWEVLKFSRRIALSGVECPHILTQSVLMFSRRIALRRGASSLYFHAEMRSRLERPRIFAQKCALVWTVFIFLHRIALSRGASCSLVERCHCIFTQKSALARSVFVFSRRTALWCGASSYFCVVVVFSRRNSLSPGASSYFRAESRSGVERPHIFAQNRALAWSVVVFLAEMCSLVERCLRIFAQNRALVWSVLTFAPRIAVLRGALSYENTETRSGVECLHIFT